MNPVSAVSLKVIAWLLSGISPGSQCPAAWQRAFSVTWWSLDISSCPGLCEEHPVVLWYTEGAYYSAVKVLWFIFSLCICVGNALLLFSHLEIAFNACQVNQRCKYECSFTEPKQAMYLRGVTKHKSKERKIALHLSEVQDGCTGLAAAACLSTHAEGDHCVDGQTTLNENISGLPSVWLWRCKPCIAHLYISSGWHVGDHRQANNCFVMMFPPMEKTRSPHYCPSTSLAYVALVTPLSLGLQQLHPVRNHPGLVILPPTSQWKLNQWALTWRRLCFDAGNCRGENMFHAEGSCHAVASTRVEILVQSMGHVAQVSVSLKSQK